MATRTTSATRRPRVEPPAFSDSEIMSTPEGETGILVPDESEGTKLLETAPNIPAPTVSERIAETSERIRSLPNTVRTRVGIAKKPSTKAAKVRGPRVPVDKLIGTVWSIAARLVQPVAWPVANVLNAQSTVAGAILEDVVKGTVVDTVLQPLAKVGKGGEVAMALIGPPILVGLIAAKPESAPIAVPLLKESLRAWLDIAGPKLIEHQEREQRFQEQYGASIDQMMELFFTPPEGMAVPNDASSAA